MRGTCVMRGTTSSEKNRCPATHASRRELRKEGNTVLVEVNPGSMGCPNEHKNTHSVSKELPVSKTFRRGNRHHSVSTLCHFLPHKPGVIAHAAVLVAWMLIPLNIVMKFLLSTIKKCSDFLLLCEILSCGRSIVKLTVRQSGSPAVLYLLLLLNLDGGNSTI